MTLLRRLVFWGLFAPLLAAGAQAALKRPEHVKATLVSAESSIQPGRPFTVALRLEHEPHWHTYWLNPGTGLATTLQWTLPEGFSAGEIQWPAPIVLKDSRGTIVGNGYEGETFLPVTITPPAALPPGQSIELKVEAEWLMCSDVCIPGDAELSLVLPVEQHAPATDPTWGDKIARTIANLPRSLPDDWQVTATRDAQNVTITLRPLRNQPPTPRGLHFFSDENLVGYDQPQNVVSDGRGGFVLTAPIPVDAPENPTHLRGVITSENGWLADGSLPGLRVDVPFGAEPPVANDVASNAPAGLGGTLLLAFVGGLILNLMPCVFPVLGLKILGFVNQAGHERSKVVAHGLVFTLGVLLSFWVLAGVLAVLRAGGDQLGWGFQLQSPAFVFALAVMLLVFGLNLSGVFEFGLRATSVGSTWQTKSGFSGSFFTGVLATVVATPCSAPFLAPALGAALALSTVESFAIFSAIAVGLSTPYLLLSIFPQAVKVLPRPGAWMETFKQFMAFPLYGTVAYLIWVLAGQVNEDGLQNVLFGLVVVALGAWLYGRWTNPGATRARSGLAVTALVVIGSLGVWLGWPRSLAAAQAAAAQSGEIVWEPWSAERVAALRAEGRTIYVDFTARWCFTCQTNKKVVFTSDEVRKEFAARNVATLRADWTNQDPRITAELARYGRSAVPFNLFWFPGANEAVILPEILTPGMVLDALRSGAAE